jgi:peptide/nickel transport system ATP-binding protein
MKQVQPIFQNPFEAFNPLKRVDRYLSASAPAHGGPADGARHREASRRALGKVGLSLAEIRGRFPHELSGGQLQRVAIARALISRPALLVADEPVSMIDARCAPRSSTCCAPARRLGVSIIYITHDLATAYYVSDRIVIMRAGRWSRAAMPAPCSTIPQHPYLQSAQEFSAIARSSRHDGAAFHA